MQEVFDLIRAKLEDRIDNNRGWEDEPWFAGNTEGYEHAIEIVNQVAEEYNNGWIPCSERLPVAETEVLILAKRKYRDGTCRYIVTNAMYEDGTVSEYDSAWRWEDIDGEYDEENDCVIIPKGWWENKHYNPNGELNYATTSRTL